MPYELPVSCNESDSSSSLWRDEMSRAWWGSVACAFCFVWLIGLCESLPKMMCGRSPVHAMKAIRVHPHDEMRCPVLDEVSCKCILLCLTHRALREPFPRWCVEEALFMQWKRFEFILMMRWDVPCLMRSVACAFLSCEGTAPSSGVISSYLSTLVKFSFPWLVECNLLRTCITTRRCS